MSWLLPLLLLPAIASAQVNLWLLERLIALGHPVPQISTDSLAARLQSGAGPLLFDARTPAEYAVSHLRGAIRVDPDLSASDFLAAYGDAVRGKDLVFYCSVGYRSSLFVERLRARADAASYASIANLRGGLFRWYNENRPLYADSTRVDTIHPYSPAWSRFLKKKRS